MNLYPIMLDLTGRLAVVVGAGPVACRKIAGLRAAGARTRVVAPDARPGLGDEFIVESYHARHLDGAAFVIAAATPEVNRQVVADARARGVFVNAATDPEMGDVFLPAVVRRGDLCVTASTQGAAPAAARAIREWLERQFDDAWAQWLILQRDLRERVLAKVADPLLRQRLLRELADVKWVERLRREGFAAAREATAQVVDEALGR